MPNAEFEAIHTSPRGAHTPPPRGDLSALMAGKGTDFGVQPRADGNTELADQKTTVNHPQDYEKQQASPPNPHEDTEEAARLARWLQEKETAENNKYNRTVIISPLPDTATVADVLPRIRGGVDSCYVSQFEETRVAVVTFKLPEDAITYTEFCAETPIWSLWTFQISRAGVPFTWERRAKVQLFRAAPSLGSAWDRAEIPVVRPRTVVAAGSRCLVYKGCRPHEVAGIYRALGLHKSQHQRDQVEGMWLDGPVRDHLGNPVCGDLHIWYTSIRAAQEAKMRWGLLDYEYDPCSNSPVTLMLYLDEGDEVSIFKHHEPFVNMVEVNQKTILGGVVQGIVDPVQAYWRCRGVAQQMPDDGASLASRLQWSLQNLGGGQSYAMPTMPTPYQPPEEISTAVPMTDPFIDLHPMVTGVPPQQNSYDTTTYRLEVLDQNMPGDFQPFAATRTVPPGHHLSPAQTYVARSQERQALGYPPYSSSNPNEVVYRPSIQLGRYLSTETGNGSEAVGGGGVILEMAHNTNAHVTNTNNTTNYSNLGGPNNPESGRQPRSGRHDS